MISKDHRYDIFGITALPFVTAPDKIYLNASRKKLATRLESFLATRGFVVLPGGRGGA